MNTRIALLSLYITSLLAGTVVSPILPYISISYPEAGEDFSKIFLTLPSLIIVPFLLLSGPLSLVVNKRIIVLIGLILYIISGVGNFFAYTPLMLLFFRSLSGIAAGFIIPYSALLIYDYFKGANRSKLLAQTGIVNNLGGILVLLISGVLITIYWRLGFLIYLVALIPFFLIKKNLPVINNIKKTKKKYSFILYFRFKPKVIKIFVIYLVMSTLFFVYFSNVSFIINKNDLGGAIEASLAQSFYLLAGALSNIYMLAIKRYSINIVFIMKYIFIACGFFIMVSSNINLAYIYFGSFLLGLGYGGLSVVLTLFISENTSKISRGNALSVLMSALYLGQFLSPFVYKAINLVLDIKFLVIDFLVAAIFFTAMAIYYIRLLIKEKKYNFKIFKTKKT